MLKPRKEKKKKERKIERKYRIKPCKEIKNETM